MTNRSSVWCRAALGAAAVGLLAASLEAQGPAAAPSAEQTLTVPAATDPATETIVPADYVVGAEDVLNVHFRYHEDVSGDVVVRPDGKIALPVVGDIEAAGLTVKALTARIESAARPFLKDPTVSLQPKQINSRKVYIQGEVNNAGAGVFPLLGPMTVLQLISRAGGVSIYAKQKDILVIRTDENGQQISIPFNYDEVKRGRRLDQNILLKPGDTVVVP
jgi:polysaccharide export outer membrane protein